MTTSPEPALDVERILDTLERHNVDYLVVGGIAANVYGASRVTQDFDCIPERSQENLARLAAAMQELNARLRIEGLSDAESQQLPNKLDELSLRQMELSTWRTDAGDLTSWPTCPAGKAITSATSSWHPEPSPSTSPGTPSG